MVSINHFIAQIEYFNFLITTLNSYILDNTKIFEFDTRFESFGKDFQFYDYNMAVDDNYLSEYAKTFELIICDPPFLSEECLEKTSIIVKRLLKENGMIILNTGSIQRDVSYIDLHSSK